ncbi:MAG: glycine C-acetyltransferase, partial [Spirochaetaceae bacterium]
MYGASCARFARALEEIDSAGLRKTERVITSPQDSRIAVGSGDVINFCANNYLGLANHPSVVAAARDSLDRWGFGLASVRFI